MPLTLERRAEIRRKVVEPYLDLSDIIGMGDDGVPLARRPTNERTPEATERIEELKRLLAAKERDKETAAEQRSQRREDATPGIVADFLALVHRMTISRKYGLNVSTVNQIVWANTTDEQRFEVRRHFRAARAMRSYQRARRKT